MNTCSISAFAQRTASSPSSRALGDDISRRSGRAPNTFREKEIKLVKGIVSVCIKKKQVEKFNEILGGLSLKKKHSSKK